MAGIGLNAASKIYVQTLKPQIMDAMQEGLKATFGGINTEMGDAMTLKFAQTIADKLAGPICDAIVNIVSQAQVVGTNPLVSTIIATPTTGGPCSGSLAFNGSELSLT